MPFPPSAACRFFDLPPVNLQNLPLHLTKNSFASAPTHFVRYCFGAASKGIKPVAQNRKAWHDYFVEEKYECGIELYGTEVKSMRQVG